MAKEAETNVTGGQTTMNKWCILGGAASCIAKENIEFIMPVKAVEGDVIILTKPLGVGIAGAVYDWIIRGESEKLENLISEDEAVELYDKACEVMTRLNRNAARLIIKV